jgi:hypothetical protein
MWRLRVSLLQYRRWYRSDHRDPTYSFEGSSMWRLLKVKVSDKVANAFLTSTSGSALSA